MVFDSECTPQVAACLILDINPDICIVKNSSDWPDVTIRVIEADQTLSCALCSSSNLI